ncbi:MAG: pyruvate kinase [Patescibacteria group bacterium]
MAQKRTKIVCTIGPACNSVETLTKLANEGMNVCRLNFSHGSHEDHAENIRRIREVSKATGKPLAILQDLQGPKIRVGKIGDGIEIVAGNEVVFTSEATTEDVTKLIPVTYPNLHEDVKPGQRLLLDDGLLEVQVLKIEGIHVHCKVLVGGLLKSSKGLNLPETETKISAIPDKDRADVDFGVQQGVDFIALSFVRKADDIRELRELIEAAEKKHGITRDVTIKIIAKVEKPEAVRDMDEIVEATDGIMVARGDLGIEMPAEKVPLIQKRLIEKCLEAGKPVIVATQMLDSMIRNPRATRAEISDIANAVVDHTDATMLSGETASGTYPVESVQTMAATIREIEESTMDDMPATLEVAGNAQAAMTNIASVLARTTNAKAIVVATKSGASARLVSRYRPQLPIYAMTPSERVLRQLNLSWGVQAFHVAHENGYRGLVDKSVEKLVAEKLVVKGDMVIVVAGDPSMDSGSINMIELRTV